MAVVGYRGETAGGWFANPAAEQLEAAGWVMVWYVMANAMRSSNCSLMIPVFCGDLMTGLLGTNTPGSRSVGHYGHTWSHVFSRRTKG
jgi:hypothetical protein